MASPKSSPAGWLWAGSVALVVFAARCGEIQRYTGDVPHLDQWRVEAQQILLPWLKGTLTWTDFFQPHHEHIPAWTRLLAWLEAAWLGRWDPLLQCTINAALFGLAAGVWSGWLRRVLPVLPALILTAITVALASLPHGWENTTWGFQSLVPIALLMVIWHVRGSFEPAVNTPRWWIAQAAGLGALFTFGSMWAAPAAVALTVYWTAAPGRGRWLVPALLAMIGILFVFAALAVQPHAGALAQSAISPQQFLAAFLLLLGWPSSWPGVAIVMYLPTLLLALKLRRNAHAENVDRIALALALAAVAQGAAIALSRAGGYIGFTSRYGDLLSLGVMANAFALWRLLHGQRSWRPILTLLALGWLTAFSLGLNWVSTHAHTEYFHSHATAWNALRHDAVKQYLTNRDASLLSSEGARKILYPDASAVSSILDQPGLSELLPVSVRPAGPRARGDFVSAAAWYVRNLGPTFLLVGSLLFLLGFAFTLAEQTTAIKASPELAADRWSIRLVAGMTAAAGLGVLLWPMPLEFRGEKRWGRLIAPPGAVTDLRFQITTPTTYQVDNLTGGADLWPENFRNTFYGTHIDGPAFKGRAQSSPFPLNSPWVVMPYAGFPASEPNGLRLQIEDRTGRPLTEINCLESNPSDIDFWSADVRAYAGQQARLVIFDGRDDAEGWVAVAGPQPAQDGNKATRLRRDWAMERTTIGHNSIGVIFLTLLGLTGLLAWSGRHNGRRSPKPTGSAAHGETDQP